MNRLGEVPSAVRSEPLEQDGSELVQGVLSAEQCERLAAELTPADASAGNRNLLSTSDSVWQLAHSAPVLALLAERLGQTAFPVRALFFDKTPSTNWRVPWHQDLTIAVAERHEVAGFGPWSIKDGIPHVQPPVEWLERMISLRFHLDDCGAENGPLRVLPGSHLLGRLAHEQINVLRSRIPEQVYLAGRGDVLLMRPLLLHASSPAARPGHRRVIHIEYATDALPDGLQWHDWRKNT